MTSLHVALCLCMSMHAFIYYTCVHVHTYVGMVHYGNCGIKFSFYSFKGTGSFSRQWANNRNRC